ncbi:uncharacterized protein E0L32_008304 [Thyridium curvatum]|uniref:Phosphoribosylaminoimidazole-succinocarboxamide synthase n=1 Tax=Thyridium curvatum TaxID=1093900 RepID=A0A507AK15_9PEZI|nr:uncharacterized protein E0L32_008304 [Thyridium curvatum]TPX10735.1 hypothetical protein E0L32_008304 [Thyridium curvatum]
MNFQSLNFDYVERPQTDITHYARIARAAAPRTSPQSPETQSTVRPHQRRHDGSPDDIVTSRPASLSSQLTVIPLAPSPPSPPSSESELYGPDRLGPSAVLSENAFAQLRNEPRLTLDDVGALALHKMSEQAFATMASSSRFKDGLALEAGKVTPGVDDTPYIQYALEAITRDPATWYSKNTSSGATGSSDPSNDGLLVPDRGLNYYGHQRNTLPTHPEPAQLRPSAMPAPEFAERAPAQALDPHPSSNHSSISTLVTNQPKGLATASVLKDAWSSADHDSMTPNAKMLNPRPDFRPRILRPISMMTIMTLCLLMIAALIFSAVFSQAQQGLVAFVGTIYSAQYFVFRILPQLIAAALLMYAQCIVAATIRVLPFTRLEATSSQPHERPGALFQDLYPRSFLWPTLVGTWHTQVPIFVVWMANITLPLQSALFTFVLIDREWRWAAVQGVAWTLVVLYIALLAALAMLWRFWSGRRTGLLWDARSIADIIAIISHSNTLRDYQGTEVMATRDELMWALRDRCVDKLGYWYWRDQRSQGFWYALGTDVEDQQWLQNNVSDASREGRATRDTEKSGADFDVEPSPLSYQVRYRYLPWCLRNNQLLLFVVAAVVLLTALLVVSFIPATDVHRGFLPLLSAAPGPGAFSAADFLYSFLPSLLGLVLFLLFQSLDMHMRILEPWAELARHEHSPAGAHPETSILADYAACLPLQSTWHALRNRHFRLAGLTLLSTLLVLLPVLAGGVFTALTQADGAVRMIPSVPVYALVLALLALYLAGLAALLPARQGLRLPHAVTCLAEVISLVSNDDVAARDEAFRDVRFKRALRGRIGVDRAAAVRPGWVLGVGADGRLGVRRARRFTERGAVGGTSRRMAPVREVSLRRREYLKQGGVMMA